MKVGLYSPYLETMGGGERYLLTAAKFFLDRGDSVAVFWDKPINPAAIKDRFSLDLTDLKVVPNVFKLSLREKCLQTARYDLIFVLSDGSLPWTMAKKNILHFQIPFRGHFNTFMNNLKMLRFSHIVCNSKFTKKYIDESFGVSSEVLYPPVDIAKFSPSSKKKIILSVGRFFAPDHPKKQELLISSFKNISARLPGWKLVLIGGTFGAQNRVSELRQLAGRMPVEIITDSAFKILQEYYSSAAIYWHAAGFGEDLATHPEKAEHFGITTVEAMAAGTVPIVFAGGGQREIITSGLNGLLWETPSELEEGTLSIINDQKKFEFMAIKARQRSEDFSQKVFFNQLKKLIP